MTVESLYPDGRERIWKVPPTSTKPANDNFLIFLRLFEDGLEPREAARKAGYRATSLPIRKVVHLLWKRPTDFARAYPRIYKWGNDQTEFKPETCKCRYCRASYLRGEDWKHARKKIPLGECEICSAPAHSVDHIVLYRFCRKKDANTPDNLMCLCRKHHGIKGGLEVTLLRRDKRTSFMAELKRQGWPMKRVVAAFEKRGYLT